MTKLKRSLVTLALVTLVPGAAHAQACLGLPSFASGSVHLNAAGEFPDGARAYAGGLGAGWHDGLFANLGGGLVEFDDVPESATFGFLEFGWQLPLGPAQLCPIAGGTFAAGPDDDAEALKLTSRSATAGVALGVPIPLGAVQVVPNAAVKYDWTSLKTQQEGFETLRDEFRTGIVDVGLALIFFDRVSIQPLVHIPFASSIEGEETSWGVFAAFSFGWRAR